MEKSIAHSIDRAILKGHRMVDNTADSRANLGNSSPNVLGGVAMRIEDLITRNIEAGHKVLNLILIADSRKDSGANHLG